MDDVLFPESLYATGEPDSDGVGVVQRSTLRAVGTWAMLAVVTAVLIGALMLATWVAAKVLIKVVEHVDDGDSASKSKVIDNS